MSNVKECDPRTPDVLSPKIPMAMIGLFGLLLAAFAILKLVEAEWKETPAGE